MESIKAWHIMREGIRQTIKLHIPGISEHEIERIIKEIERECSGLSIEDLVACVYRKIEEIKSGKARRI